MQASLDRLDLRYMFPRHADLQSLVKCLDHRGVVFMLNRCASTPIVYTRSTNLMVCSSTLTVHGISWII